MEVKVVVNITEEPTTANIQSTINSLIKLKSVTELQINVTPPKAADHLALILGRPIPQSS